MNKLLILVAGVIMMSSCGATGSGAMTGAMFGGVIGSCIGGIGGGPRGSDIGTLVGMATGAAAGAAVGNAVEKEQSRQYYAPTESTSYTSHRGAAFDNETQRTEQPVYDDVIKMDEASDITLTEQKQASDTDIRIENVRFINKDNTCHISKGELVKISFEVRNTSILPIYNIVPVVQETTKNKRLMVSPSIMIETLDAHKAIRYTAFVSAQENIKTGTARFRISVKVANKTVSNIVEFDISLD